MTNQKTTNKPIIIYGAPWCPDCRRSKTYFDQNNISYNWIDIDEVAGAADKVAELNDGLKSIPTIIFPDDSILVEPSNKQLADKLASLVA